MRDNGVLQSIASVEVSGPVNVVLALDTSASLAGAGLRDAISAGDTMVGALHDVDRIALTTFNESAATKVHLTPDFSSVSQALRAIAPAGESAVTDGIYVALAETLRQPGRSLVVVCTDGRNTAGWLESNELIEAARRSNAVVYVVVTGGARHTPLLEDITDLTGGHIFDASKSGELAKSLTRVITEFRSRYVLTFIPQGVDAGGLHRLEVRTTRGGLSVRSRSGYVSGGAE